MKQYKFIGEEPRDFGGLGIVEPGQVFDVDESMFDLFDGTVLFKEIVKKVVKKEKDGD
jgi:hypothetical protein